MELGKPDNSLTEFFGEAFATRLWELASCGKKLSMYNAGPACWACQPKMTLSKAHMGGCAVHGKTDWYEPKRRCRICDAEKKRRKRGAK